MLIIIKFIYYDNFNKVATNFYMSLERNSSHTCTRQNTPPYVTYSNFIPVLYFNSQTPPSFR